MHQEAETTEVTAKAGLVPGLVWLFCPQKKGDHTGDYHKVFHGKNFFQWWIGQLLRNLHQPSLIMLDNAAYHLVKDDGVPKVSKLKKAELKEYLISKGDEIDPVASALELREMAKDWIKTNEKPAIVKAAEALCHRVLFTPPYHSDLQPIELVWALIKGNIGREYKKGTSLEIVHQRLLQQFKKLDEPSPRESVQKMIENCAATAKTMYEEIQEEDGEDEYMSDEEPPVQESQIDVENATDDGDFFQDMAEV